MLDFMTHRDNNLHKAVRGKYIRYPSMQRRNQARTLTQQPRITKRYRSSHKWRPLHARGLSICSLLDGECSTTGGQPGTEEMKGKYSFFLFIREMEKRPFNVIFVLTWNEDRHKVKEKEERKIVFLCAAS